MENSDHSRKKNFVRMALIDPPNSEASKPSCKVKPAGKVRNADSITISRSRIDISRTMLHRSDLYLVGWFNCEQWGNQRRGELLKLRWSDVDFVLNTINFKQTKSNKDRSVPMEPIVRTALSELREVAGDLGYVFVNPDTGTRYTEVKRSFATACREAGITDFRFHDLRHTFGLV